MLRLILCAVVLSLLAGCTECMNHGECADTEYCEMPESGAMVSSGHCRAKKGANGGEPPCKENVECVSGDCRPLKSLDGGLGCN